MQSVLRMNSAPLGFRPAGLTTARINLPAARYADEAARRRFYRALEQKLEALPGVESAAFTSSVPPENAGTETLEVFGASQDTAHLPHDVIQQFIGADYFRTVGTPLLASFNGRPAASSVPQAPSENVVGVDEAVIDDTVAAKYFPQGGAIGSRIRVGGDKNPWLTVTGIAATARRITVMNEMQWVAQATVFRAAERESPLSGWIVVRSRRPDFAPGEELRRAARSIDAEVALGQIQTMRQLLGGHLAYPRFRALVFGGFALFALLLAAVGIYGVIAGQVAQRTQEIGVRMALGARPADVARLIARGGGAPVLAGLAVGLAAALGLGRYLSAMLYGVSAQDPATLAAVAAILLACAALALALPARRAARVDPAIALRVER